MAQVDWLNKVISEMWPYLAKVIFIINENISFAFKFLSLSSTYVQAIPGMIRSTAEPIFADYIGKFQIDSIEFDNLSVGSIPPLLYGNSTPTTFWCCLLISLLLGNVL